MGLASIAQSSLQLIFFISTLFHGFIFPNAPCPTQCLRFRGIGSTSNNEFNGVSVHSPKFLQPIILISKIRFGGIGSTSNNEFNMVGVHTPKFSPADLPCLNTMPVHPLPLLCLRSWCCSCSFFLVLVNKAANVPSPISNCPLAQTPLFHCPMISLCCNAPCAC